VENCFLFKNLQHGLLRPEEPSSLPVPTCREFWFLRINGRACVVAKKLKLEFHQSAAFLKRTPTTI
jgi:hypothetical protein